MILTLNVGSSSLKYAAYDERENLIEKGAIEEIGKKVRSHAEAADLVLKKVKEPKWIGHRIVHGGSFYTKPTRITDTVVEKLESLIPFSPLHLPEELEVVKKLHSQKRMQVACFDTAFHRAMPKIHQMFPLPSSLWEEGVKRYGFHGLSYEYILSHLGEEAKNQRIIIAHLGNGASMAAVKNGQPIDTTMGLTPAGGIMMGTRSGDLDPGILTFLMREKKYGSEAMNRLVNQESGLLGVSEKTHDMHTLLQLRNTDPKATEAISLFCYLAKKAIGSLAAALGGVDLLIFTAGIGERSKEIREEIMQGLEFLEIHKKARVIETDENLMIARHTRTVLQKIT